MRRGRSLHRPARHPEMGCAPLPFGGASRGLEFLLCGIVAMGRFLGTRTDEATLKQGNIELQPHDSAIGANAGAGDASVVVITGARADQIERGIVTCALAFYFLACAVSGGMPGEQRIILRQ